MAEEAKPILPDHIRQGKLLVPRLVKIGVQTMDWETEYLPEYLWLAYLIHDRSVSEAAAIFNAACDIVDDFFQPIDKGHIFAGHISDLAFIPDERRFQVLKALGQRNLASASMGADFRRVLGLYAAGPGRWLGLEPDSKSLSLLRQLVALLYEQKTGRAAQCRILGLNRLFKHQLMFFTPQAVDDELLRGLQEYPNTDDEMSRRVEQFVRLIMNTDFQMRPRTGWALGFWIANLNMVKCQ